MAHSNIDTRQAEIAKLIGYGVTFDKVFRLSLAERFQCSVATIAADIKRLEAMRFTASTKTAQRPDSTPPRLSA